MVKKREEHNIMSIEELKMSVNWRVTNPSKSFKKHLKNNEFSEAYNNIVEKILIMTEEEKADHDNKFKDIIKKLYDLYNNENWLECIMVDSPYNTLITIGSNKEKIARTIVPYVFEEIPIEIIKLDKIRAL